MTRKKGSLQGRFVNGYLRENPHRRGEYVKVSEYQEHIDPSPSRFTLVNPQGELDLAAAPAIDDDNSQASIE
jgi:hypothetical protein